jgi:hypothetical protein
MPATAGTHASFSACDGDACHPPERLWHPALVPTYVGMKALGTMALALNATGRQGSLHRQRSLDNR